MKKVSLNNKKKLLFFYFFIFFYTTFSHFWHKTQTIMDWNHFQQLAGGFVKQQFCLPSESWLNVDFVGFLSQRAGLSLPQTEAGNILLNCVCLRSCCFLHCCSSLHSLLRRVLCHRQLSSQGKPYHGFGFFASLYSSSLWFLLSVSTFPFPCTFPLSAQHIPAPGQWVFSFTSVGLASVHHFIQSLPFFTATLLQLAARKAPCFSFPFLLQLSNNFLEVRVWHWSNFQSVSLL